MKNWILTWLAVLPAVAAAKLTDDGLIVQDIIHAECEGKPGRLNFTLNRSTSVVTFTDIEALGRAQMPVNLPIAAPIRDNTLAIEYVWYFTAYYELRFGRDVRALGAGDLVAMSLNGDDYDGSIFDSVPFECLIK